MFFAILISPQGTPRRGGVCACARLQWFRIAWSFRSGIRGWHSTLSTQRVYQNHLESFFFFFDVDHFKSLYWICYSIPSVLVFWPQACEVLASDQGLNLHPVHWKVKSYGPPSKSLGTFVKNTFTRTHLWSGVRKWIQNKETIDLENGEELFASLKALKFLKAGKVLRTSLFHWHSWGTDLKAQH